VDPHQGAAGVARTGRGEPPAGRRGEKQAVFASAGGEAADWVRDPFHSHDPNMGMRLVFGFCLLEIALLLTVATPPFCPSCAALDLPQNPPRAPPPPPPPLNPIFFASRVTGAGSHRLEGLAASCIFGG